MIFTSAVPTGKGACSLLGRGDDWWRAADSASMCDNCTSTTQGGELGAYKDEVSCAGCGL